MLRKVKVQESRFDRVRAVFKQHGGILRIAKAIRLGIHPDTLYRMRDSRTLEVISRGVYRLAGSPPLGNPDLVTVATRVSGGVVCLISVWPFMRLQRKFRMRSIWHCLQALRNAASIIHLSKHIGLPENRIAKA